MNRITDLFNKRPPKKLKPDSLNFFRGYRE
jgi:hypothetical protein